MFKIPTIASLVQAMLILAAGFWVFSPAFHGGWLWDDGTLIGHNGLIHDPAGLWKIWFEPGKLAEYFPITASVEWLEWHAWHGDTLGYHLASFFLHVLSALLVWRLFSKFNLRLAWLGGLLFAVHPLAVESVAWISELKNTLSLPFFLLAMGAWIDYDRLGKQNDYFRALGLFLVAMLCKSTMMMFPLVVLLYAWWRRDRIKWNDLRASAPFFAISLMLGLLEVCSQHQAGAHAMVQVSGLSRAATAGWQILFFFFKSLFPARLLPIYPSGLIVSPSASDFLPWLLLGGLLGVLWFKRDGWGRHALLGIGFFLLNLIPVLGLILVNATTMVWSMDHLAYIPIIGLIGLVITGCGRIDERLPRSFRPLSIGAMTIVLALLAVESHDYAGIFVSQEKLWTYVLQGNPGSEVAHNNLGLVFLNSGRLPEAIAQFDAALKIKPDYAFAHNGLGNALILSGRGAEAIDHYQAALRINPDYPEAHNGLANVLLQSGRLAEAKAECELSLKLNPRYAEAYCNLGLIQAQEGQIPEAIEQFETALRLNPADVRIQRELESLHTQQNDALKKK